MLNIAILGSTGSIGTQALDVIRNHSDELSCYALSAHRSIDLLISQAREFHPKIVCVTDETLLPQLREALVDLDIRCLAGEDALVEMVSQSPIDMVLASMVGYVGLKPTLAAIRAGKDIALANKETLVVAGELVCAEAKKHNVRLLPVDSEHSAIFQSLQGEDSHNIEKILLTASGGPFRGMKREQLSSVTAADALRHPNWQMGAKITIDSATLMNKGFEVIEAKWLFSVPTEKIQVLVHPQSIVHSAVQFVDGSVKAQLATPDMRLPIQYAFTYPERRANDYPRIDFFALTSGLTFEQPDIQTFRNLQLAYDAMNSGGNMPCILNAANEVVVAAFLQGKIGFLEMSDAIATAMAKTPFIASPSYDDYVQTDALTRQLTTNILGS